MTCISTSVTRETFVSSLYDHINFTTATKPESTFLGHNNNPTILGVAVAINTLARAYLLPCGDESMISAITYPTESSEPSVSLFAFVGKSGLRRSFHCERVARPLECARGQTLLGRRSTGGRNECKGAKEVTAAPPPRFFVLINPDEARGLGNGRGHARTVSE